MMRIDRSRKLVALALFALPIVVACSWDPRRPFEREAPAVREAIHEYESDAAPAAADLLQTYLSTGACAEGNIGTPDTLKERREGTYDLSLALFRIAEQYGAKFGEDPPPSPAGMPEAPNATPGGDRAANIECALRVVRRIATDRDGAALLRARARYLEGNLLFLDGKFKEAVTAYDASLTLVPATASDSGAAEIAANAAWNRAIAKRRAEEEDEKKKDAGGDGGQDASPDSGNGDGGKKDQEPDAGKNPDGGGNDKNNDPDKKNDPPPPSSSQQPQQPPPRSDDRLLDQLENAPTVQQEVAKKHGKRIKVQGSADK